MDAPALRALARQTYERVEPHGNEAAVEMAAELRSQGLEAGAHEDGDLDSFDEVQHLEWALGRFIDLVDKKGWFAMNSLLNKLHELGYADAD
jgi:hypothetical protein